MSKITNDGLTRSGTRCFTHMATVGIKGLRQRLHVAFIVFVVLCTPIRETCAISDLKFRIKRKNELNSVHYNPLAENSQRQLTVYNFHTS